MTVFVIHCVIHVNVISLLSVIPLGLSIAAGDYEVQGSPVMFTPGDQAESVKFVAIADNVKELNETVSLMLQIVDDGGIDVELCPQSTTVVTILDNDGRSCIYVY